MSDPTAAALARVVEFFEQLSPERMGEIGQLYAPDAWFKDPFNDVRGTAAIERIFRHLFAQVDAPRFRVTQQLGGNGVAMIEWEMAFRFRGWRSGQTQTLRGVTRLRFDERGRVTEHRDYWDAAEELYAKLPLLGALARRLARAFRA